MQQIGDLTPYTCPECGGVLWKTKNEPLDILLKMAENRRNLGSTADEYEQKASEMKSHVVNIRRFIVSGALHTQKMDMEA